MLGETLKKLRGKRTQEEMAKALGISRARYSHYENNARQPDNETLQQLADFFGVSTDYLLGRNNNLDRVRQISEVFEQNKESVLFLENNLTDIKKYRNNMLKILESIKPTDPGLEKQAEEILMLINYMDNSIKGIEEMKEAIQNFNNILVKTDTEEIDRE